MQIIKDNFKEIDLYSEYVHMVNEYFKMQFSVITYWFLRIIYIRTILEKFAHQVFIFRHHM